MNSKRSWSPFRGRKPRSQSASTTAAGRTRGEPSARAAAIEKLIATSRYLTDGVELYRVLGAIIDGACDLLGMENCRSLELVLAPVADLHGGRLWSVAPTATRP